ncbi:pilus assembly protein [Altericroceibacterium spongiae]|uniref:Pilus assembly protein n=1 Tax=Altericroceibacterium spongiae TaxID=2320269 RepID=A0A420EM17_9SPHN|nr:TadE/TadG family type IV pilus assembly protein [Altericroceibacterium spongiae]RKF21723.1 pilus assembly protein [Altericroceibacterium spongiae]
MMRSFLNRLAREERGAVAIEFALWTVLFFFVVTGALDFGMFYIERSKVNKAVSAASITAFENRSEVDFAQLPDYVRALSDSSSLTVSLSCNGAEGVCTNTERTCACLTSEGTYVAKSCNAECTGSGVTANSTAGYYLTIDASRSYEPVILPKGALGSSVIEHKATVRLQ